MKARYFYNQRKPDGSPDPYYQLTNFAALPIYYDGVIWTNSEQAFQAQKFAVETRDPLNSTQSARNAIWLAQDARAAYDMVRKPAYKALVRKDWRQVNADIMIEVVGNKILQNPELIDRLLKPSLSEPFIEDTSAPKGDPDDFYGCGPTGGVNALGIIHQTIADLIRQRSAPENDALKKVIQQFPAAFKAQNVTELAKLVGEKAYCDFLSRVKSVAQQRINLSIQAKTAGLPLYLPPDMAAQQLPQPLPAALDHRQYPFSKIAAGIASHFKCPANSVTVARNTTDATAIDISFPAANREHFNQFFGSLEARGFRVFQNHQATHSTVTFYNPNEFNFFKFNFFNFELYQDLCLKVASPLPSSVAPTTVRPEPTTSPLTPQPVVAQASAAPPKASWQNRLVDWCQRHPTLERLFSIISLGIFAAVVRAARRAVAKSSPVAVAMIAGTPPLHPQLPGVPSAFISHATAQQQSPPTKTATPIPVPPTAPPAAIPTPPPTNTKTQ